LQNCGFLWADVAGFGANPAVPFVNASWPQFISRLTHPFFELQRSLQMNVPGEPESMVAIMKISIISKVVKTKLTAS
jgi:hypothetical protein